MRKVVLGMLMMLSAPAAAADVDWKFFGTANFDGQKEIVCFYEAGGITRMPGQHVRVWTKCLVAKDVEKLDAKTKQRIAESTAKKIESGYIAPIVNSDNFDQAIEIVAAEEMANIGGIEPDSRIFYELDCPQKMLRWLSADIVVNGKHVYRDTPDNWEFAPPEGNGARLLKMLCR